MSVKNPSLPARTKIVWTAAGVLCAIVLVLLWITAQQIKDRKMKHRYGEKIEETGPPPIQLTLTKTLSEAGLEEVFSIVAEGNEVHVLPDAGAPAALQLKAMDLAADRGARLRFVTGGGGAVTLTLPRDRSVEFEHFTLTYGGKDRLTVYDSRGRHAVDFTHLEAASLRRWQELQIGLLDLSDDATTLALDLSPGSPCSGPGRYYFLKPGLTWELAEGVRVQIRNISADGQELTVLLVDKELEKMLSITLDGPDYVIHAQSMGLKREDRTVFLVLEPVG